MTSIDNRVNSIQCTYKFGSVTVLLCVWIFADMKRLIKRAFMLRSHMLSPAFAAVIGRYGTMPLCGHDRVLDAARQL